jgi:hypothetical protein
MDKITALAEAWASMDGKLDAFRREMTMDPFDRNAPDYTGHYEGYMEDTKELLRRLETRGYTIVPILTQEAKLMNRFDYFECPECEYDLVLHLVCDNQSVLCPLCMEDSGHRVRMKRRDARDEDKPEGIDMRREDWS